MSRQAYAIFVSSTRDPRYIYLALACARGLRQYDKERDIGILIADGRVSEQACAIWRQEGCQIWREQPIASIVQPRKSDTWELTKIRAWRHTEYEKILYMDADIYPAEDPRIIFEAPGFACKRGRLSPLSSGKMLLEPSRCVYVDLIDILLNPGWDRVLGWRRFGLFPHWFKRGEMSDWQFNGAAVSQGLLFYYFDRMHNGVIYKGTNLGLLVHTMPGDNKWQALERYRAFYEAVGCYQQLCPECSSSPVA